MNAIPTTTMPLGLLSGVPHDADEYAGTQWHLAEHGEWILSIHWIRHGLFRFYRVLADGTEVPQGQFDDDAGALDPRVIDIDDDDPDSLVDEIWQRVSANAVDVPEHVVREQRKRLMKWILDWRGRAATAASELDDEAK